jgi:benzil reductase ((S)-benzoin forming)
MTGIYIITGTSRGIGLAVATRLLETGHRVFGMARTPSPLAGRRRFHEVRGSVTDPALFDPLFDAVLGVLADADCDFLCLLNNAAVLEPMKPIETCTVDEIRQHVDVNLTAPIMLSARFMARFGDLELRKKVVFMTSGAGRRSLPDMSLYCSVKAGLSRFAECVGREQEGQANGFEIAAISPGMVETDMQKDARAKSAEAFRSGELFRGALANGIVQDADVVASKICAILEARTAMGETVSVADW